MSVLCVAARQTPSSVKEEAGAALVSVFRSWHAWQNREFTITARGGGRFHLSGDDLPVVYEGMVGTTLKLAARGGHIE